MKLDYKWIIIVILLLASGVFSLKMLEYKEKFSSSKLENQQLTEIINKNGETITLQESITTQDQENFKRFADSVFALSKKQEQRIKDVISYYSSITKIGVEKISVPYIDSLAIKEWEDSVRKACSKVIEYYEANTMPVPRDAKVVADSYEIDLTVRKDSVGVNKIQFTDSQYIRFVTLKGGILKKDTNGKRHLFLKKKVEVQVKHTNKDLEILGQSSAVYVPPKKKTGVKDALLIGTGIFLGTKL